MPPARATWLFIGYLLLGFVIWESLDANPIPTPDIEGFDKLSHVSAYGLLMVWFGLAYCARAARQRLFGLLLSMGLLLEVAQGLGGVRFFELKDLLADFIGLAAGVWALRLGPRSALAHVQSRITRTVAGH